MTIADRIESLIDDADNVFIRGIDKTQQVLYDKFLKLFKDLELDADGYILNNQINRGILQEAGRVFNQSIREANFKQTVEDFAGTVYEIDGANEEYFSTLSSAFKPNRAFISSLQRQTITNIENLLLNSGLESQVKGPLLTILSQNINSGGSYSGFLEQLRENILGMENEGKLMRYSRGIMNDSLFQYSRAYQQSVTSDLGLEWYMYSGGITEKTREFCADHSEEFYHQAEVEAWASEDWTGQIAGTTESSIFIFAGGWNCRHSIIPVDISIVPQDVIQRNIDSGNYVE